MNIADVLYESIVDGEGVRATIFISGCKHNCKGCFNKKLQNFNYGYEVNNQLIDKISKEIEKRTFLSGITLSGGDPFYQPNEVIKLIKKLYIPQNNIWAYTGFTFEEILTNKEQKELLSYINVLVDGEFIQELHDATLAFRGSSNQRIIDVQQSLINKKVILYKE